MKQRYQSDCAQCPGTTEAPPWDRVDQRSRAAGRGEEVIGSDSLREFGKGPKSLSGQIMLSGCTNLEGISHPEPFAVFSRLCVHPQGLPERRHLRPNRTRAPALWSRWARVRECRRPPMCRVRQTCGLKPVRGFRATLRLCCRTPLRGRGRSPPA